MPEINNLKESQPSEIASASAPIQTGETTETASNHSGRNGDNGHLTSGRLLAKNTVWNLIGNGAPAIVAVFCIPVLIRGLGKERFGLLTLAWVLIGYAGLFDLGLGRALTQLVAQKLGIGEEREIPSLVWTSLLLMLVLGLVGTAVVFLISPWLAGRALNVPGALLAETQKSFRLIGYSIPVVITATGMSALLEAHQRFGLVNSVRIPMGVFTVAGPLLVLPFSKSLVAVVAVLVIGRVFAWAANLALCLRVEPELRRSFSLKPAAVGPLLRFGGWITIANIVNPILVSVDRFFVGAALPVVMVGYYTAPFDTVTKLWMVPRSLTATVFPACSSLGSERRKELEILYSRSIKYLFLILAPISLVLFLFAGQIMQLWLGHDFAEYSTVVLRILAVGVFVNCFAHVPYCFLQALGRPDATAKLFLIELVPYGVFAWSMIRHGGIVGAATAWSIRVVIEVLLLIWMAWRMCSLSPRSMVEGGTLRAVAALCILGLTMQTTKAALQGSPQMLICLTCIWLVMFALAIWKYVFDDSDRTSILSLIDPLRNAVKSRGTA